MRKYLSYILGLLLMILVFSKHSYASSTKEVEVYSKGLNLYINAGLSYNYPYGYDFCIEMASIENQMRGLIFRVGGFRGNTSYGIDFLFHGSRYDSSPWWTYKGISLFESNQQMYIGLPLGIQANWGGFIEVFPMLGAADSYLMIRSGIKTNLEQMFNFFRYGVLIGW